MSSVTTSEPEDHWLVRLVSDRTVKTETQLLTKNEQKLSEHMGQSCSPGWPLGALVGQWHIDHTHERLSLDGAVGLFVHLFQHLVVPFSAHRYNEATARLQLFDQLRGN